MENGDDGHDVPPPITIDILVSRISTVLLFSSPSPRRLSLRLFSRRVFSSDIDIPEQKITNDYYHPFFLLFVLVLHNAPNPYNPQLLHQEELRMEFKLLDKYA